MGCKNLQASAPFHKLLWLALAWFCDIPRCKASPELRLWLRFDALTITIPASELSHITYETEHLGLAGCHATTGRRFKKYLFWVLNLVIKHMSCLSVFTICICPFVRDTVHNN